MIEERTAKNVYCTGCGAKIMRRNFWVDNSGPICRNCATVRIYKRMRRNANDTPLTKQHEHA
jgi:formylmethanofuran dehydrogenase subunit E